MIRRLWLANTGVLLSLFLTCSTAAGGTAVEAIAQGQTLLEKVCVVCHDDERIRQKKADRGGWRAVVGLMKANGATIDDQQGELVVAFLAARSIFEAKCSACHGFDRPLDKHKAAADWRATVERMGAKRPGHLNEAEIAQIADYLTVVRPIPSPSVRSPEPGWLTFDPTSASAPRSSGKRWFAGCCARSWL